MASRNHGGLGTHQGPSSTVVGTSQQDTLCELRCLVEEDHPWYEALGPDVERASEIVGEEQADYVEGKVSRLSLQVAELVLSAADVDALKPACVCFRALFHAIKGAAQNRDDLLGLIDYGILIVKSVPNGNTTNRLSSAVKDALKAFGEEVEGVIRLADSFSSKRKPTKVWKRFFRRANHMVRHADIKATIQGHEKKLKQILSVLTAGAALQSAEDVREVLDGVKTIESFLRPPTLLKLAAVPLRAASLTNRYVERSSLLASAILHLTEAGETRVPCVLAGMGGAGKTFLASAIVRDERVREHFCGGIHWFRLRRGANDQLRALLSDLVSQLSNNGVPTGLQLENVEDITRHLTAACSNGAPSRLIVLDDVWERDIIDALRHTGLQLVVTTRDRGIISTPAMFLEVGNLDDAEALQILRASCGAPPTLELPQAEALQVVDDCGRLALTLGLAATLLKGAPQNPSSWRDLHNALMRNFVTDYRIKSVEARTTDILEASFGAMCDDPRKQEMCTFLAILAPGVVAPLDMLEHLWEEAPGAVRTTARQLVEQSMLQPVDDAYRVHDIILRFLKSKLMAHSLRSVAISRMAGYLGKLNVLNRFFEAGMTTDGVYALIALWKTVEGFLDADSDEWRISQVYTRSLRMVTDIDQLLKAGRLMELMGKFKDAEPFFERCLTITEQSLGQDHPHVASAPNSHAVSLEKEGRDDSGEPSVASFISEIQNAYVLHSKAGLLEKQGKYEEADLLYALAIDIGEKTLGCDHPVVATRLCNRAGLLVKQGKYDEAESLFKRALEIDMNAYGPDHAEVATDLSNWAVLLEKQGKYEEADHLLGQAIAIKEKILDRNHPMLAPSLINRATILMSQGNYGDAEALYERSLTILEKALGPDHPDLAQALNNWALLLRKQGKINEAGTIFKRSLAIREKALGPDHEHVAESLHNLAVVLVEQMKYEEAQSMLERVLAIEIRSLGVDHPSTIVSRAWIAKLYEKQGLLGKASSLLQEIVCARERMLGNEHPDVALTLRNLAAVLSAQGKYLEAYALHKRSLAILEKALGHDHPNVAKALSSWAEMLQEQGENDEAEHLYERAIAIGERFLVPDHLDVATWLNSLAMILHDQGRHKEAVPLFERAIDIRSRKLGGGDEITIMMKQSLEDARNALVCKTSTASAQRASSS